MSHHSIVYINLVKLIKTIILLSIPVGVLAVIFWNIYPITKIILFSFIALIGVGIFDRLLSWSFGAYEHRRGQFFAFLIGIILGIILVSNEILPKLIINVVK